jgi:hypothetical protein
VQRGGTGRRMVRDRSLAPLITPSILRDDLPARRPSHRQKPDGLMSGIAGIADI